MPLKFISSRSSRRLVSLNARNSSGSSSKWFSIEALLRPVTNRICRIPFETSSSTTYCTIGLRATGNISFGWDLVAGNSRVPSPATGISALLITSIDYRPNLKASRSRYIVGEDKAKMANIREQLAFLREKVAHIDRKYAAMEKPRVAPCLIEEIVSGQVVETSYGAH